MDKKRRIVFVIICAALLIIVGRWVMPYDLRKFQGGIGIYDSGFWSYPRYHAHLGRMPMWKDGDYQFNFRGLPSEDLSLSFYVEGGPGANPKLLESLTSNLYVEVVDGNGTRLCSGGGTLSHAARGRDSESSWVLSSSDDRASFYFGKCLDVPMSQSKLYQVHARLEQTDSRSPHTNFLLELEGGGNELP